jgi:DNA-binding XRE family transcriptional regulator
MMSSEMAMQQTIVVGGKPYVLVPPEEYERLTALAGATKLPPLPLADEHGNYPAVEYARASLARKIVKGRVAAGLTQRELARRAGIGLAKLSRIEAGQDTPTVLAIDKLDRALKGAGNLTKQASKKRK